MTRRFHYAFLMIVFALVATSASAQVQTGTPPFGSFGGGPDVINLANLNSHISIPVLHKAGRGLNFTYDVSYDSSVWYPVTSGSTTSWQPVANWGWRGQTEIAVGYVSAKLHSYRCPVVGDGNYQVYDTYVYHDMFGIAHAYAGSALNDCNGLFFGFNETAADGSSYSINVTDVGVETITSASGTILNPPIAFGFVGSGVAKDRNGNQITVNGNGQFFDTLSSTTPVLTASGAAPNPVTFTYTAPSGASASYTMKYTALTIQTAFGCSGISEYNASNVPLVTEIDLPDQAVNSSDKYTFTYEFTPGSTTTYTGRLNSVTLPTGGTITYTYTGGSSGHITCADGSMAGLTRALTDGASWNATWTYSRSLGTGAASTTTITDPSTPTGNQTVIQFQGIYETQRQVYQGSSSSGTLLETRNTCYNGSAAPCTGSAITLPIASQAVTTILPGTANLQSKVVTSYNSYGQLTEEDDYPYGSGAPGSLLRKKLITIQTVGTYQAIQKAQIQDGFNNVLAQTTMTFDQGSVTATTGTPQHTNPTVGRGNPTTISYLVQGSTSVTKTLTFYDTGNVQSITDVNGAATTYNYPDSTSTCGNSFPTSVTEPISGLSQSIVWNCTGGVETSATDENGKTLSTSYTDAYFWRPNSTTDQLSNVTNLTYTGQTSLESSMNFNSNSSTTDSLVTVDGLGRSHITQTKQGPSSTTYDSVETDYDVVGRPYRVTTPYSAAAGQTTSPTAPATTTTYDALGRVLTVTDAGGGTLSYSYSQNDVYQTVGPAPTGESTKRRQLEYDSLGRLTSVCEITSGTGNGTCAQTNSQTGYWTKYTYDANGNMTGVTQNAQAASGQQQTRSYSYDGLSRMTSETNPESGTTTYVYDSLVSDPNCGTVTYSGDLVKWTDAVGNIACSTYDLLHRTSSTTYSGPYAPSTPIKNFVYDTATVNSVAMVNAKTRLAEAYTCVSPCSSKITDVGFSYTARGEVSDAYESTPHSSGYYHVSEFYWANGGPNQLNAASCSLQPCFPGLPMFTYGADGEGRPSSVSASSGQNPVTGTTYSLYSSPPQTTVNFGSGDSDVFNYDSNTRRTTQYKFNVGSQPQSVVGQLNWNVNGSLRSLAITDPFNSPNAQTCNYAHDDLSRIASANCGSIWSQTFSFDAFGNINKSGNSSFSASYSPTTNQMTSIGGSSPSYDGNGNVTNDFLHAYSWDAEGRPVTIDTVGVTYDALGRMVELNRIGTYTEIAYAPTGGKLGLMSGQTLQRAFVALPGGATAVYTSSGLDHYRHSDWLGSARLTTTTSQTVYGDAAYAPYGETYAQSGNTDFSWTRLNADVEPANPETLYDFPAREYGIQGRWPSPDPLGLGAVDPSDPQSWNRYAYVGNNPLSVTDPTGMGPEVGGICAANPIACVVAGLFEGLFFFFGHHHHHPTPQAPPAPPGGYGAGIDPYGTWDESIPGGVQVFPPPFSGIQLPSDSGCDFGVCGLVGAVGGNPRGGKAWSQFVIRVVVYAKLLRPRGRSPGQGFGPCVNENMRLLSYGKVDPSALLNSGLLLAETVGTIFATARANFSNPITGGTFSTTLATGAAWGLRAFGASRGGIVIAALGANAAADVLAVAGAATGGAVIGSAINCAPVAAGQ